MSQISIFCCSPRLKDYHQYLLTCMMHYKTFSTGNWIVDWLLLWIHNNGIWFLILKGTFGPNSFFLLLMEPFGLVLRPIFWI
jgi:hypothetical protein